MYFILVEEVERQGAVVLPLGPMDGKKSGSGQNLTKKKDFFKGGVLMASFSSPLLQLFRQMHGGSTTLWVGKIIEFAKYVLECRECTYEVDLNKRLHIYIVLNSMIKYHPSPRKFTKY